MREWVKRFYNKWGFYPICGGCGGDDDDNGQEAAYDKAVAPARQYQADMSALFKQVYEPYVRDIYGLWSELGKPIQRGQLETYRDVGLPAYKGLGTKLSAEMENPWLETRPIFEDIWKRTRERTAAEWAPIEQRTSQRLAGAGALGSGAALKAGTDIELGKYKSLETQAIDMALQEFNIQAQQKQLSYENMFRYLNYQPNVNTQPLSQVGQWQPEVIPPYISQQGQQSDLGGLFSGLGGVGGALIGAAMAPATGGMSLMAPLIGMSAGAGLGGGIGSMIKY